MIPNNLKKEILNQLDSIGINEAKLFPDIEHQAKSIISMVRQAAKQG